MSTKTAKQDTPLTKSFSPKHVLKPKETFLSLTDLDIGQQSDTNADLQTLASLTKLEEPVKVQINSEQQKTENNPDSSKFSTRFSSLYSQTSQLLNEIKDKLTNLEKVQTAHVRNKQSPAKRLPIQDHSINISLPSSARKQKVEVNSRLDLSLDKVAFEKIRERTPQRQRQSVECFDSACHSERSHYRGAQRRSYSVEQRQLPSPTRRDRTLSPLPSRQGFVQHLASNASLGTSLTPLKSTKSVTPLIQIEEEEEPHRINETMKPIDMSLDMNKSKDDTKELIISYIDKDINKSSKLEGSDIGGRPSQERKPACGHSSHIQSIKTVKPTRKPVESTISAWEPTECAYPEANSALLHPDPHQLPKAEDSRCSGPLEFKITLQPLPSDSNSFGHHNEKHAEVSCSRTHSKALDGMRVGGFEEEMENIIQNRMKDSTTFKKVFGDIVHSPEKTQRCKDNAMNLQSEQKGKPHEITEDINGVRIARENTKISKQPTHEPKREENCKVSSPKTDNPARVSTKEKAANIRGKAKLSIETSPKPTVNSDKVQKISICLSPLFVTQIKSFNGYVA